MIRELSILVGAIKCGMMFLDRGSMRKTCRLFSTGLPRRSFEYGLFDQLRVITGSHSDGFLSLREFQWLKMMNPVTYTGCLTFSLVPRILVEEVL